MRIGTRRNKEHRLKLLGVRHTLWIRASIGLVALAALGPAGIYVAAQRAKPPIPLGVQGGRLAACPATPNCVSSMSSIAEHTMPAWAYQGDTVTAKAALLTIVQRFPRATIVQDTGEYVHAVFRSRVMGFPDDVEFLFDTHQHVIHFRSASRLGRSDFGVNRARMEQIGQSFAGLAH